MISCNVNGVDFLSVGFFVLRPTWEAGEVRGGKVRVYILHVCSKYNSMAKKLYIGGISYSTNDEGLKNAFAQAGNVVSASIIMDKMTGRSRGFGFVEMATDEEAQAAIAMWNGKELDGRTLTVNEARPMAPRGQGGGFGGGGSRGGSRGGYGGGGGGRGGSRW